MVVQEAIRGSKPASAQSAPTESPPTSAPTQKTYFSAVANFSARQVANFRPQEESLTAGINYLHGVALIPQLFLSQRQGYVAAAPARFLGIIGVKHIPEFLSDFYVTIEHVQIGTFHFSEISVMSGDLFAAVILSDFL